MNSKQNNTETQCKRILAWLKEGNSITALQALTKFGCFRLASRICDLKSRGEKIESIYFFDEETGKRYKIYYLSK